MTKQYRWIQCPAFPSTDWNYTSFDRDDPLEHKLRAFVRMTGASSWLVITPNSDFSSSSSNPWVQMPFEGTKEEAMRLAELISKMES